MNEFYLMQGDNQTGPFTLSQLQAMWRSGSITGQTLYCEPGFDEWFPLSTMSDCLDAPREAPTSAYASAARPPVLTATKKKKSEFAGAGAAVQAIGLLLCLTIAGAIIGVPLLIIGGHMAIKHICSNCGNQTTKDALMCSSCRARFI